MLQLLMVIKHIQVRDTNKRRIASILKQEKPDHSWAWVLGFVVLVAAILLLLR